MPPPDSEKENAIAENVRYIKQQQKQQKEKKKQAQWENEKSQQSTKKRKKKQGHVLATTGAYHIKWVSGTDEMPSEMMKKVKKVNEKESNRVIKRETWDEKKRK